ncbi:MAG TPA: hypothetical protein PKC24_12220 [Cyclobacteriaceae bacterium]|nr:hypothetical protein [Cyclobacteriaceae bacterium]
MKNQNIVHEYFKRDFGDYVIYVRLNPYTYKGTELTVLKDGSKEIRELSFDEQIHEDLAVDNFIPATALEFQLYAQGLA